MLKTTMLKGSLAAAAVLGFAAFVVSAQTTTTPPTPPAPADIASHIVARLTKLLDLNSSQQTEATTIFTTEETTLATLRTSLQNAHTALQTAITGNDSSAIATQATQIGTLTGQQVQAQATASAAFYAILTADQQSKYTTLGPLLGPGGPGGFGGPGGPGGPGPRAIGGSH